MFHELHGYLFCRPPTAIASFDSFNIFELVDSLLTVAIFQHLRVARPLARLLLCRDCDGSIVELELANLELMWYEDYSFFGRQSRGDHVNDAQIKALFERLKAEHGHLDILVNNATARPRSLCTTSVLEQKPDNLRAVYAWFTISVGCELLCGTSLDRGRWGACGECFLLWGRLLPPGSGLRCHQSGSR